MITIEFINGVFSAIQILVWVGGVTFTWVIWVHMIKFLYKIFTLVSRSIEDENKRLYLREGD